MAARHWRYCTVRTAHVLLYVYGRSRNVCTLSLYSLCVPKIQPSLDELSVRDDAERRAAVRE